jgi:hypothetical protein
MYPNLNTKHFIKPDANMVLAAGFCERWPKAWRGGFALVLGQLLIMEKNLPLTRVFEHCAFEVSTL